MVQVDVFWSYGLGAGFAIAAARQLRVRQELRDRDGGGEPAAELAKAGQTGSWNDGAEGQRRALSADDDFASGATERALAKDGPVAANGAPAKRTTTAPPAVGAWADFKDLLQNRFMVANVLYAAMLFAPSGIYLLWGFPNWETMQAGSHSMPAWLIVLFAITNVTQAIVGFWVTERLIVSGRQYLGFLQAWVGYFGMFFLLVNGWDKTGWHRFFSEDRADFKTWASEPALDQVTGWLTSDVALTLYGMGAILIPIMAVIMIRSLATGYRIGGEYRPDRKPAGTAIVTAVTVAMLLSGVPAAVVAHQMILWLGWIGGAIAGAAVIFVVLLWSRTGLLYRGYRMLALEDVAYRRLNAEGSRSVGDSVEPEVTRELSYSNQ
ncbi:MAG: hypothetical protein HY827_01015 [Actinobacteria bacterium]|nr:hypothetical protein [Actinomycetota bacterium]